MHISNLFLVYRTVSLFLYVDSALFSWLLSSGSLLLSNRCFGVFRTFVLKKKTAIKASSLGNARTVEPLAKLVGVCMCFGRGGQEEIKSNGN